MNNGWIKLHRKLLDNPIAKKPAWAWLWVILLLLASHDDKESFIWNGKEVVLKKGQFVTGRKKLAQLSGISETTIERALKWLESGQQIGQQKTTKYRLITILKWEEYQKVDTRLDNRRTTDGQQTDTIKNLKKVKKKSIPADAGDELLKETRKSKDIEKPKQDSSSEPMVLHEYVASMRSSPQRYINLIGEFADEIKARYLTKGQWKSFTNRYVRVAKNMEPFDDDQIGEAVAKIKTNMRSLKNPKGFITEWDMDTIYKYLTK